jgi:WD40 repeat protein
MLEPNVLMLKIWASALNPAGDRFVTGGSDGELNVWTVGESLELRGSLKRASNERVSSLSFACKGNALVCHTADKTVHRPCVHLTF